MLAELGEELHSRNIRFILTRVIMPVRQMLESAGAMEKIKPQDIFIEPSKAVLDYLSSQYDAAAINELLLSATQMVHRLLDEHLASAPADQQAGLAAIADSLDQGIKRSEK
jgi:hypothetical protein